MADNEEQDHMAGGVNEWEVVSLTASTYAASPGPRAIESNDDNTGKRYDEDEAESSRALFMSNHFIFPPNQHENLPLEPESSEILDEQFGQNTVSIEFGVEGGKCAGKDEAIWPLKDINIPDEFPGMQFFDEKAKKLPISGTEFDESTTLKELSIHEKDHSIYSASTFSSFHGETGLGISAKYGYILSISDVIESSEKSVDSSTDIIHAPKPLKDVTHEAWWKRRAASLYNHAKEANTFWSLFVAAAVMGLVILGHRWQQVKWQSVQLKWHSGINEKTGRMLGPISQLKDAVVGGHGRGSSIRGNSSSEN